MGSTYLIISVEDDEGIFDLIKATLRPLPVELHHASSGEEALQLIPKLQPDVIVLDIALPDIHGWTILDRLDDMSINQPDVVVLSALLERGRPVPLHQNQVNMYMSKPFIPAELRHNVSELLGLA
ncbi:MAG: response regulator [Chloroflexi bacterium]|nr:response regulator [Chloroflexota bacterium]